MKAKRKTVYDAEIYRSKKNGKFYFRIRSANGNKLVASEGYNRRRSAEQLYRSLCMAFDEGRVRLLNVPK